MEKNEKEGDGDKDSMKGTRKVKVTYTRNCHARPHVLYEISVAVTRKNDNSRIPTCREEKKGNGRPASRGTIEEHD